MNLKSPELSSAIVVVSWSPDDSEVSVIVTGEKSLDSSSNEVLKTDPSLEAASSSITVSSVSIIELEIESNTELVSRRFRSRDSI